MLLVTTLVWLFWLHYGVVGFERHDDFAGQSPFSQVSSQIMFLVLGVLAMAGITRIPVGVYPRSCGVSDAGYRFDHAACCGGCRR